LIVLVLSAEQFAASYWCWWLKQYFFASPKLFLHSWKRSSPILYANQLISVKYLSNISACGWFWFLF